MGWFSRRRHRLGFGVHSPFAYSMVKDIIAPSARYRYYAEETIADSSRCSRHITRLAIIVHRLVGRNNYKTHITALPSSVTALFRNAIDLASPVASAESPSMLITSAPLRADTLTEMARKSMCLLCMAPYTSVMPPSTGILFHDTQTVLYFPYEKTAFVSYDIRF